MMQHCIATPLLCAMLPPAEPCSPRGGEHRQGAWRCGPLLPGHQGQRHGLHLWTSGEERGTGAERTTATAVPRRWHGQRGFWEGGVGGFTRERSPPGRCPGCHSLMQLLRALSPAPRTLRATPWRRRPSRCAGPQAVLPRHQAKRAQRSRARASPPGPPAASRRLARCQHGVCAEAQFGPVHASLPPSLPLPAPACLLPGHGQPGGHPGGRWQQL